MGGAMADFSTSDAIGAGFGLIARRPLSVLAWGLIYFILAGLPALAMFAWVGPDYFNFIREAMQGALHPGDAQALQAAMAPTQMKLSLIQPLLFVGSLLARAILAAAVLRAVLEPGAKSFASVRLGAQELWLALLFLVMMILFIILIVALAIFGLLAGFAIGAGMNAAHAQPGWIALCVIVLGLVAIALVIWIAVRFSMAAPMTFADREFRLFESWTLTKGKAWRLFLLGLLLALIMVALVLVIEGTILAAALISIGPGLFDGGRMMAFFQQPPDVLFRTLAPWMVGLSLVGAFLAGAFGAISIAPWAVAYRELTAGRGGRAA